MPSSITRSRDLVGRESSQAGLRRVVDEVVGGRGRLVLITGEPGVGKSALAEYGCGYASGLGAAVVWGACWEGDGVPGFWPWQQVVRAVAGSAVAGSGAADGAAGDAAGLDGEIADEIAGARRFRLFAAVTEELRRAAARRPLVVVIDDLHWADAGAVRLLGFAARQLRRDRVLLVGTYREDDIGGGHPLGDLLAALPAETEVVPLGGLDVTATAGLLHRCAGVAPTPALAAELHRRTGGNPFFITQLAPLLGRSAPAGDPVAGGVAGGGVADCAMPAAVGEAIQRRLAGLAQPTRELLTTASAIGTEFDAALLSAVADVAHADVVARLAPAVRAGVLGPTGTVAGYRFAHDLFREALYAGIGDDVRARTHLAVATALSGRAGAQGQPPPGALAHHYALAVPAADPGVAVGFAVAAAEHAMQRLAYEEAVLHWRQALRLFELAGPVPLAVRLKSAESLLCAGEHAAAWGAFADAARVAAATGDAAALGTAALGLHRLGGATAASRHEVTGALEQACTVLDDGRASPLYARVLAALSRELTDGPKADPPRADVLAHRACATAHASGDQTAVAWCLLARHDVVSGPGSARQRLAIADEMAAAAIAGNVSELLFQALFCRFAALLELADPQALAEIRELERVAAELNLPRPRYLVMSSRAALALLRGEDETARRLRDEAARFAELIGEADGFAVHASQRLVAALGHAGWAGAAALLAELGDRAVPPRLTPLFRAMVALGTGDRAAATEILRALPPQIEEATDHAGAARGRSVARWHALAGAALDVELATAVGLADRCGGYYERLAPYADELVVGPAATVLGPVALYLGVAAAAQRRWEVALTHLDEALAAAERLAARPLATRVRARQGLALLARGAAEDRSRARSLLAEAAEVADELGLEALRDEIVEALTRDRAAGSVPAPTGPAAEPGLSGAAPAAVSGPSGAAPAAAPGPAGADAAGVFRRDGEVWTLRYASRTVRLRDAKGLRDLAVLLSVPGREVPATRLLSGVDAPQRLELGGDEVLDQRARAAYKARLVELDSEIAEAEADHDDGRLTRYRTERQALVDELARAYGLGGRVRRLGDPGERARSTVTARIRDTLRRIERAHPDLASHLNASVVTGRACCYRPTAPVRWEM